MFLAGDGIPDVTVTITDYWLTFIISTLLPIVVALATKRFAASKYNALVMVFLNVIVGFFTSLGASGGSFDLKTAIIGIIVSFVTAYASHAGLLKPLAITGDNGAVKRAVSGGLGSVDTSRMAEDVPQNRE